MSRFQVLYFCVLFLFITCYEDSPNRAPTSLSLSNTSLSENKNLNTSVGLLESGPIDLCDNHTYRLISGQDNFKIDLNTLRTSRVFDYETKNTYTIRVRVSDGRGGTYEKDFTITIQDENDKPTTIRLSKSSIVENNQIGASIGIFTTIDSDARDKHTYTLIAGTEDFRIDRDTLRAIKAFDYEVKNSYVIRVETHDNRGETLRKDFIIKIIRISNSPPTKPILTSPVDSAKNIRLNTKLTWQASTDTDGDALTYDVYLDKNNPPTTKVATGQTTLEYTPSGQDHVTTYYWKVIAKDSKSETESEVWLYTTKANSPPTKPILTSPVDSAKNIRLNTKLTWQASTDTDGDALTYDVYLDKNNPPTTKVATGQTTLEYTPSGQDHVTTYYWKVIAKDSKSETESEVWLYTTKANSPPTKPILTSPVDSAKDIRLNTKLTWQASTDTDGDALTYDVYLDKNNPPTTKVATGQTTLEYTPSGQDHVTTYYWKVIAKDSKSETESEVWLYTTAAETSTVTSDGKTYKTVKIGDQWWMAENLNNPNHTKGRSMGIYGSSCLADKYGRYYNWEAAIDIANKIPGWHLPTDQEWKTLEKHLGMTQVEADKDGQRGTDEGAKIKAGAIAGFNGLYAGYHNEGLGAGMAFWTASEKASNAIFAWSRYLYKNSNAIWRHDDIKSRLHTIRLIKD